MNIDQILQEIFMLDPELKSQEKELRKFIVLMIKHKPNIRIDEQFVRELKSKLESSTSSRKVFALPMLTWLSIPAALALVIILAIMSVKQQPLKLALGDAKSNAPRISTLQNHAFGNLTFGLGGTESGKTAFSQPYAPVAPSQSGLPAVGFGGGQPSSLDSKTMLAYDGKTVTYTYDGADVKLITEGDVMRRVKNISDVTAPEALIASINSIVNSTQVKQSSLSRFQMVTKGDRGYIIDVDLTEGYVSMNENWITWPHPESSCTDQNCYDQYRIKIDDIPSDENVISVTKKFIDAYGINISSLGAPVVNNDWKSQYEQAPVKSEYYLPDMITVTYPYLYNNKTIIDESGNSFGVQFNVNVRLHAVVGVNNLISQKYESSSYTLETSAERIVAMAKKGGLYPQYSAYGIDENDTNIKLGTPSESLVKMTLYSDNVGQDLIIPAYVFPVLNEFKPGVYFRKQIIVPAVKEVLDQMDSQSNTNGPIIEPMVK